MKYRKETDRYSLYLKYLSERFRSIFCAIYLLQLNSTPIITSFKNENLAMKSIRLKSRKLEMIGC